jgi:C1A family cysteine protease
MNQKYCINIKKIDKSNLNYHVHKFNIKITNNVDLRNNMPSIYDQGELGSCTANGLCALIRYNKPNFLGSRLFLYYNERYLENTTNEDSGAYIYDGIKSLQNNGICPESEWPYDITKFTIKPPDICYKDALIHKATKVVNIKQNLIHMKNSLTQNCPFVVGIAIYESFESYYVAKTGIVNMPKPREQLLGGHCVVCCGYIEKTKRWIMRNSWGSSWGDNGYFYLPYNYLLNHDLCSDLWAIINIS